ncbi:MAG TPA: c-type cytochrome [Blastocatellia bacterium]|nr:c-type cytochrome [Blastocatellia bacterium]
MYSRVVRVSIITVFLLSGTLVNTVAHLRAQEGPPPSQTSGQTPRRGNRGTAIREFLGLGPAPDPVAAERGQKLYQPNCAFCHGEKARGADGPSLIRSELVLHDEKGELIGPVLQKGRTDKGMPAFASLTETQIQDLAQFIHMQVELAANRGTYRALDIVTGDPKKGEAYFTGAGQCNTCHSITGDLAHIATKYPPDQLQNRFLWPEAGFGGATRSRKVTVTPPSGKAVSGTLKRIDDFHVSLYDASGTFHSWLRDGNLKVEVEDPLKVHRQLLDKYTDADIHNLLAYLVTLK